MQLAGNQPVGSHMAGNQSVFASPPTGNQPAANRTNIDLPLSVIHSSSSPLPTDPSMSSIQESGVMSGVMDHVRVMSGVM